MYHLFFLLLVECVDFCMLLYRGVVHRVHLTIPVHGLFVAHPTPEFLVAAGYGSMENPWSLELVLGAAALWLSG